MAGTWADVFRSDEPMFRAVPRDPVYQPQADTLNRLMQEVWQPTVIRTLNQQNMLRMFYMGTQWHTAWNSEPIDPDLVMDEGL